MSAYRAVFLRVHPTGKAVLSLSGTGDQRQLAQIVTNELGIPLDDTEVVQTDYDRFGDGHGFLTDGSAGTANAVTSVCRKIRDKAQLLAGGMLGASPGQLTWGNGAWYPGRDPSMGKRIEEIALYAHAGAIELPPGMEGSLDAQTAYRD
jgi:aerobic carbon-monoxide dehydrogenase large subunit